MLTGGRITLTKGQTIRLRSFLCTLFDFRRSLKATIHLVQQHKFELKNNKTENIKSKGNYPKKG